MLASFLIQVISLLSLVNRLKSHSHSAISLGNNVYVKDILVLNLDRKEEKYNIISKALDKLAVTHTRYSVWIQTLLVFNDSSCIAMFSWNIRRCQAILQENHNRTNFIQKRCMKVHGVHR